MKNRYPIRTNFVHHQLVAGNENYYFTSGYIFFFLTNLTDEKCEVT